jgi:glycosyltransferase involved in cell wall biosynthesis
MAHHIVIDARIRRASTGRPIHWLVEELQAIDHTNHYTILVEPGDGWHMHSPTFRTLPCPYPQFSLNPLHQLGFAWQLYRLKPSLVHFTMTQQPLPYFGKIVTMTHDTTMYHFVRRGNTPRAVYTLKMGLYRFLVWWSHRKSNRIIVPARTVAQEFMERQPSTRKKLVVTYEAVGVPAKVTPEPLQGLSGDFILYVGTAFPHKNLSKLVQAFDILHTTRPHLKLVLVGKTEKHYKELQRQVASHPSAKNIMFTGFVSDGTLRWLMGHCQAYVFTSLSEGFGLPPLDAMAYGAPVVSSNASVMPEIYGNAAHYCNPHDPADIAAKVSEVLDNKELRTRLVATGKQQVKKYSWRKMAKETLDVYQDVLAPKGPAKEPDFG